VKKKLIALCSRPAKHRSNMFDKPKVTASAPTPNGSSTNSDDQFAEIEQLQLQIIEEQIEILASVENLKTQSILLLDRVRGLSAMANNKVIPELEKIINTVGQRAKTIDSKVDDLPPAPPIISTNPPKG
jgi:hypothetical protein